MGFIYFKYSKCFDFFWKGHINAAFNVPSHVFARKISQAKLFGVKVKLYYCDKIVYFHPSFTRIFERFLTHYKKKNTTSDRLINN